MFKVILGKINHKKGKASDFPYFYYLYYSLYLLFMFRGQHFLQQKTKKI